jgi:hypothetical protein
MSRHTAGLKRPKQDNIQLRREMELRLQLSDRAMAIIAEFIGDDDPNGVGNIIQWREDWGPPPRTLRCALLGCDVPLDLNAFPQTWEDCKAEWNLNDLGQTKEDAL